MNFEHIYRFFRVILVVALATAAGQAWAWEVVNIEQDARFAPEAGVLGMDKPAAFADFGLYTSTAPSSDKEVVIFVHGATGTPRDFSTIAASLDGEHQQAWFAFYATGNSLEITGCALASEVLLRAHELNIRRVRVVAHSMGGLVAWYMVRELEKQIKVTQLVTIATPWDGHWAATLGKWFSPNPRASWIDLASGSACLETIHLGTLATPHVLIQVSFSDTALGDGVISENSQLQVNVSKKAATVIRILGEHSTVLHDNSASGIAELLRDQPVSMHADTTTAQSATPS